MKEPAGYNALLKMAGAVREHGSVYDLTQLFRSMYTSADISRLDFITIMRAFKCDVLTDPELKAVMDRYKTDAGTPLLWALAVVECTTVMAPHSV